MSLTLVVDGNLLAVGESSGFDVRETDEALAVRLFVAWHRAERARMARDALATARRSHLRLVTPTRRED